ncbi:MAG: 2-amino-4-hydroxy-6-hydroxymethyldihydropteridine diphosphokinase [Bacteroidales bacterium]
MAVAYIGIGSNIGDRNGNLLRATEYLSDRTGKVISLSGIYETEPWGFSAGTPFLNMAAGVETALLPGELLKELIDIETGMGRVRSGSGYQSRIIDLDILFYDDLVLNTEALVIPHPLLHRRSFVLDPLAEIAPDLVHPF